MTQPTSGEVLRVELARLSGMRSGLPKDAWTGRERVDDFHRSLDRLEAIGCDMSELRIPGSWIKRQTFRTAGSFRRAPTAHELPATIETGLLAGRIDAVS